MKKLFTLCFAFIAFGITLHAQTSGLDEVYQFTDPTGEVVYPHGSELVFNTVENGGPFGGGMIYSNLHVLNTSESTNGILKLTCTVTEISNGAFQICWPTLCRSLFDAGTIEVDDVLRAGQMADLQTEFIADTDDASCKVTYQIVRATTSGETFPGSSITVTYTTDPNATGISGVTVSGSTEEIARYSLDGARLSAPQKGINIVKYADGRTVKRVVK